MVQVAGAQVSWGVGHLQVGQAAALAMQLLDLVGVADVALVQRLLFGVVGRLQVLEVALVPKFYIAAVLDADMDTGAESDSDSDREVFVVIQVKLWGVQKLVK